jgi:hypothetical protein
MGQAIMATTRNLPSVGPAYYGGPYYVRHRHWRHYW